MSFQIYQLEKSQALDVLDRVQTQLDDMYVNDVEDNADDYREALNTILDLKTRVERMTTELSQTSFTLEEIATAVASFESAQGPYDAAAKPVEWFSRYFSNFNIAREDFQLAAGYPLRPDLDLLREQNWTEVQ